jgi:hypothetical protein|tara:strand:- start:432 stop:611 length:180 start_codon:yes stop_codon:yes gene_type:complete
MRYLIVAFIIVMLSACENTRHSIGISGKPLATGDKMEDSVKFNYKIIFGKVRPKEDDDD